MEIERLRLHHYPASRSARAKWILHEVVGDAFEVARVDLYRGVQYGAEFLRLNPNHGVPVLEIDWSDGSRQVMLESAAMVAFLADAYPAKQLAPAAGASPERADYLQMLHFAGSWADMMLWQVRIHEHVLPPAERDPRTVLRYRQKFTREVEPQLAARLERGGFACGDSFTAADCVVGHCVTWARGYGMCSGELFRAYVSRLSKRPAFAAAFADAGEFRAEPPREALEKTRFTG